MRQSGRKLVYVDPAELPAPLHAALRAAGWEIFAAPDADSARATIQRHDLIVGLITFDERYPVAYLNELRNLVFATEQVKWVGLIQPPFLASTANRRLVADGLYDFHTLPADTPRLIDTLGHAYGMASIYQSVVTLDEATGYQHQMIGSGPVMNRIVHNIRKIAAADVPVLIIGESGTGKELAAHAIHGYSSRAKGPFLAVNCGALPANLIQSELFGHEKGAFTGAYRRKIGRLEAANGGTIFLDEIGDLPLDQQVNLLRFLQESTIERLGSPETITVDVRVIAATHRDLKQYVQEGLFREDLYYRLNVLHLELPPLRQRDGDIELLANFFFQKFSTERNHNIKGFSQQALHLMNTYHWPGNVRELINRVRRAIVMCEHRLITPADLGLERRTMKREMITLERARAEAEKQAIQNSLRQNRNNVSQTARQLGVSRVTLYRLMEKHKLHP